MTHMHVLITGGAGFIGSHSTEALLAAGARVTVLDNFSSGKRTNLPEHANLNVICGDIRDPATVDHALNGVNHVLHLAAQVSGPASVADPLGSGRSSGTSMSRRGWRSRRSGENRRPLRNRTQSRQHQKPCKSAKTVPLDREGNIGRLVRLMVTTKSHAQAPARSLDQRMEALQRANDVRVRRAQL